MFRQSVFENFIISDGRDDVEKQNCSVSKISEIRFESFHKANAKFQS